MILAHLKHETQAAHAAIERRVDLPKHLRSIRDYSGLLARFWGFYAPIEERLAGRAEWARYGIAIQQRMKAHVLASDLRALGWPPQLLARLPRCHDLPALGEFPQALGCLYVLEGATLGGQYIRRQARAELGLTAERGCAFFSSYGDDVGPMWQAFRAALNAAAHDGAETAAMVRGAQETFETFDRWLASKARQ